MRENMALLRWLETAVSGIRFKPDRLAVRAELYGHLEDRTLDLMRLFPDMDPDEARDRALSTMGDAEELKKPDPAVWANMFSEWGVGWREVAFFLSAEGWQPGDRVTLELDSEVGRIVLSTAVTERVEMS